MTEHQDSNHTDPQAPAVVEPLAALSERLNSLGRSVPVIPPFRAHRGTTLVALLLLIGFGLLGTAPSSALAPPQVLRPGKDGQAPPLSDPDANWHHTIKGAGLEVDLDEVGHIAEIRALGGEAGANPIPFKLYTPKHISDSFSIRAWRDSPSDSEGGTQRDLRVDPRGFCVRKHILDGQLEVDVSVTLGRDTAGADRRFFDIVLELRNTSEDQRLNFGYFFDPVTGLALENPKDPWEALNMWGAVILRLKDGTRELRTLTLGGGDAIHPDGEAEAVAVMSRYGLVALSAVDLGSEPVRRRAELLIKANESRVGLRMTLERLELAPRATARHHFRFVLGPKSSWTIAGHEEPSLRGLTSNSWAIHRFFREVELDFIQGALQAHIPVGLTLLFIGFLTALLLRPLSLTSTWSGFRTAALQPVLERMEHARQEALSKTADGDGRRKINGLVGHAITTLYQQHAVRPALGCLLSLLILPMLIGFYDAVDTGFALRKASFLWISDLAQPDAFFPLERPLLRIPFAELPGLTALQNYDLTFEIKALHLLPFIFLGLNFIEWLFVRTRIRPIGFLISLALFVLLFFNLAAGAYLAILGVRCVWISDRVRVARYLASGGPAPEPSGGRPEDAP